MDSMADGPEVIPDDFLNLDREGFRQWLVDNHETAKECRVIISGLDYPARMSYLDAVEEALCFGWIDSTHNKI